MQGVVRRNQKEKGVIRRNQKGKSVIRRNQKKGKFDVLDYAGMSVRKVRGKNE